MRSSLLVTASTLLLTLFFNLSVAHGQTKTVSGIKVPAGFEVTQVATDGLANNIYSLAVSPSGETFVTGPGYIKVLLDTDGDRVFDATRTYSDSPRSGAQGVCFDGRDLICTGDGALLKFTDANGDGVSDGPPKKVFSIKTGGEHDAHSVRKGPDGWWYVLAGNGTPISKEFYASPDSPVQNPRAGFLMRISPDWSDKQIYAHGFRNAYDFDFNSLGEVFVFDSDGERDVSLPWYRPTRVFRMRPGDDAGFVERSWKRPSFFFDMPPEVGALGRGSPTGVIVGQSKSFPLAFDDAVFVADWTFGRVVVFKRDSKGQYDRGSDFAVADGQFGFAVTDLDFDSDGSLLISVGGRGTQGGVYRVSYVGPRDSLKTSLSEAWIETKRFLAKAKSRQASAADVVEALQCSEPRRRECALEALLVDASQWKIDDSLVSALGTAASQLNPRESVLLTRLLPRLSESSRQKIVGSLSKSQAGIVMGMSRFTNGSETLDLESLELVLNLLADEGNDPEETQSLARLGQLAIGGCGAKGEPAMFVGYSAKKKIELADSDRRRFGEQLAKALAVAPDQQSRREVGRLVAMLGAGSEALCSGMADQLKDDSTVPQDIHWLNCISRILADTESSGRRVSEELESKLADALVGLGAKLVRDDLNIDRNFYPQLKTLTGALLKNSNSSFPERIVERMTGAESDVFLFESLPRSASTAKQTARDKFADAIGKSPRLATSAQLNVLIGDSSGAYLPLIRSLADRPELRGAIIRAISAAPIADDRKLLAAGLQSSDLGTVKNAAIGLRRIYDTPRPDELAAVIAVARRLGWDKSSVSVRDQLMLLATKHEAVVAEEFGYQPKQNKLDQSEVMDRWVSWVADKYPEQHKAAFDSGGSVSWDEAKKRIGSINWASGDTSRGSELYKRLQCATCHDGGSRLGPKLEGLSKRFSRDDVFKAILLPDLQVPERYRSLMIETVDGKLYRGSQVYDSVDGITLQQIDGTTVRINKQDIEDRALSAKSLMPEGLLKDSSDQDWADLFEYLSKK